jgi:hypothetical protein
MGKRIWAGNQAAYELRRGSKIKDIISGFVIEIDCHSKFNTTANAAEIGLDQKVRPPHLFSLVNFPSTSLPGAIF